MEKEKMEKIITPMLFPYEPEAYWKKIREIIKEEVRALPANKPSENLHQVPGMTYKPLYKITEVCAIFNITRPTIYEWIKHGKLKPYKIQSRVYFLWQDIQQLISPTT